MVDLDGVEAGGSSSAPAEAVVGSALVALRSDLCEFTGWVVTLQDGDGGTLPMNVHRVAISGVDADGHECSMQRTVSSAELDAAREDALRKGTAGMSGSDLPRISCRETGDENILSRHDSKNAEGGRRTRSKGLGPEFGGLGLGASGALT